MHVHILGICGTFMGGVAALARAAGHRVTGSDKAVYPPMSDQLAALGIAVSPLDDPGQFNPAPDIVVVGNVMSRGAAAVEFLLNSGLPYTSGPDWLARHVLHDRHVIAVSGTHGKTTTTSLIAWLLEHAGHETGFLVGGVPANFDESARLGASEFFVVEADEYDTAFFDKRSKFVHYRPRTLVINNVEFDHADIFPDLQAIKTQFHHLLRTVPGDGRLFVCGGDANIEDVLAMGAWTPVEEFGPGQDAVFDAREEAGELVVSRAGETLGSVAWALPGQHNARNAAAACAVVHALGIDDATLLAGLAAFAGVRRRAEKLGEAGGVAVYDDFAHHPTAIRLTLEGFRGQGQGRLLAVIEPRSNTMRMGVHRGELAAATASADAVWFFQPEGLTYDLAKEVPDARVFDEHAALVSDVAAYCRNGDRVVVMSNGGFAGVHARILEALAERGEGSE